MYFKNINALLMTTYYLWMNSLTVIQYNKVERMLRECQKLQVRVSVSVVPQAHLVVF